MPAQPPRPPRRRTHALWGAALIALLTVAPARAQFPGPFRPFPSTAAPPAPPPDRRLFDAVAADDLPRVRQLLGTAPGLINLAVKGDTGFQPSTPLEEALSERYETTRFAGPGPPPPPTPQQIATRADRARNRRAIAALLLDRGARIRPNQKIYSIEGPPYGPRTALQYAVLHSTSDLVALLLDRGEDPAALDYFGFSAFHQAVQRKDLALIRLFLAHGAKPDAPTRDGQTPLELTMTGQGYSLTPDTGLLAAQALLEGGADPNRRDGRGRTPLSVAIQSGRASIAQALIAHGADVFARTGRGDTPFSLALAGWGMTDLLPTLLARGADVNAADRAGMTPLGRAIRHASDNPYGEWGAALAGRQTQWLGIARDFLDRGANPNAVDADGLTPLLYALLHRDRATTYLLLAHGAKPDALTGLFLAAAQNDAAGLARAARTDAALADARGPTGATLLHAAALWGAPDTTRLLLRLGANPNTRDGEARTPLQDACRFPGAAPVVRMLLARGADAGQPYRAPYNAEPSSSPLSLTILAHDPETARLLLAGLPRPDRAAEAQEALQDLLTRYRTLGTDRTFDPQVPRLAAVLLDAGADPNGPKDLVRAAIRTGDPALVRLLLARGARLPLDKPDGTEEALMVEAAGAGLPLDLLRLVATRTLDAKGRATDGWSPLCAVAGSGDVAALQVLLDRGADVNAPDRYGQYALALAAEHGITDAVRLLLAHGADVNARDRRGRSALKAAREPWSVPNRAEIVALLEQAGAKE